MRKVLFVGQHPFGGTGNGNMMNALLSRLDESKFAPTLFVDQPNKLNEWDQRTPWPWPLISAQEGEDDWGMRKLANLVNNNDFDIVFFVGIDIWRYALIFDILYDIRKAKGSKYVCLAPYDLEDLPAQRKDWIKWFNFFDLPLVYSKYGYEALRSFVPNLRYFRPPMYRYDLYRVFSDEERQKVRKKIFPNLTKDNKLIGFIGANQFRKDPQKLIKAFSSLWHDDKSYRLYLHCDLDHKFNLRQYIVDVGLEEGLVFSKNTTHRCSVSELIELYNCFDLFVNCSMQEGLSWTILEAFLCRCPVVATDTTSQSELLYLLPSSQKVPVTQETYLPLFGAHGPSFLDAKACSFKDLTVALWEFFTRNEQESLIPRDVEVLDKCENFAKEWVETPSDINKTLVDLMKKKKRVVRTDSVLFAQHSSAGDVLMSTQCFKGIKERHPGKKLVYMTQSQYMDIIEGNPYIDEVLDWDESKMAQFRIVYNPHGEKILPGGFNNLDATLFSMYPFFCDVEPDSMYIQTVKPSIELPREYIVVQTAGQDKKHRTYAHMPLIIKGLALPIFQIGAVNDLYCEGTIDLRGKLQFRESAYVLKNALAAVLIDSFPSHLAGSLGVPSIILYGPAPARVTRPRDDYGVIKNIEPNRLKVCPITSACWGENKCLSPCINSINPVFVQQELHKILQSRRENK